MTMVVTCMGVVHLGVGPFYPRTQLATRVD